MDIIDQTCLPNSPDIKQLYYLDDFCGAISTMQVRGAPLIGITAAYGLAMALKADPYCLDTAYQSLLSTRPTAINLKWALDKVTSKLSNVEPARAFVVALAEAHRLRAEDIERCSRIGDFGLEILSALFRTAQRPLNILTHCNAGWLATVEWGTALAPLYKAHQAGIPVHVWVDETRPRNQGASLTAWELEQAGVPYTLICDNTGGHLMQQGMVDLCLVGSDRTAANGDVCNKIGTYLKALAAHDNNLPFYVALPSSTIDWSISDGIRDIPIEQRAAEEVLVLEGLDTEGQKRTISINPTAQAVNFAFDVTPAKLITGLITECGIYSADDKSLAQLRTNTCD